MAAVQDSTAFSRGNEAHAPLSGAPWSPAHLAPGHSEEEQDDQVDGVDNHAGHQANGDRVNTQWDQTGHGSHTVWQERRDLAGLGWEGAGAVKAEGGHLNPYRHPPVGSISHDPIPHGIGTQEEAEEEDTAGSPLDSSEAASRWPVPYREPDVLVKEATLELSHQEALETPKGHVT